MRKPRSLNKSKNNKIQRQNSQQEGRIKQIAKDTYAFYIFGSLFSPDNKIKDVSGRNNHLTNIGAPKQYPLWAETSGDGSFYQAPFTTRHLSEMSNAFSWMVVSKVDSAQQWAAIGDHYSLPFMAVLSHGSHAVAQAVMNAGSGTRAATIPGIDAARGTRWAMFVGVYTPTSVELFQRHAGHASMQSRGPVVFGAESALGQTARSVRIGGGYTHTTNGIGLVATAAVWQTAVTAAQLDRVYVGLRELFEPLGMHL